MRGPFDGLRVHCTAGARNGIVETWRFPAVPSDACAANCRIVQGVEVFLHSPVGAAFDHGAANPQPYLRCWKVVLRLFWGQPSLDQALASAGQGVARSTEYYVLDGSPAANEVARLTS